MAEDRMFFPEECYLIQGAVFEVYREMGCGFLEAVYQECMEKELKRVEVPFQSQSELRLTYKGQPLNQTYKPDFLCYDKIILEIKAVRSLAPEHEAQTLNYLKASSLKLALLVNFDSYPKATIQRLVL